MSKIGQIMASDRLHIFCWHEKVTCNFSSAALYSSLNQVGGIKPGCFKIGNTGGMMDNIITSKLYRPGRSVRPAMLHIPYSQALGRSLGTRLC